MHDLYQILGVSNDASTLAIKKAFREKALSDHPDKGGDARKMALLTKAYETLIDPLDRKKFDQEWEIFNASPDTEISLTPLGYLPTAGAAFSESFKQQHAQFVRQCRQKPLDPNPSCLKAFRSDLYPCNGNNGLFSFIKEKGTLETKLLDIGILTPEKAVEYFINFLRGDYFGKELKDLSRSFYQKIIGLKSLGQQDSSEFKLYCGIYEILLVAAKDKTPTEQILFSIHKITEYAKHNPDQTMSFMIPLLRSKYFRGLFSQALHYYWLSEKSVLDESYTGAFNGQATTESLIESLKSKMSENRSAGKSNDQVAKSLRHVHLLSKLEQDLNKNVDVTSAVFHREKAFHLLDWVPSIMDLAVTVNTLLQIGTVLQKAAAQEPNPVLCMADEKLAAQIYVVAIGIGHRAKPDVELYAGMHSVKCLSSCRYADSKFIEILEALQHRALWLADLFPFYQAPHSNVDFIAQEGKTLVLMRQLLHALTDKMDSEEDSSYVVRVFYQAYEACLRNWYQESHDPEREKQFRQQLMRELLVSKLWTKDDINYNLSAPWPFTDLDEQGWTRSKSSILSSAKKANDPTYKTIGGVEFDYKTGDIYFILDYCKDDESDYNRLLTLCDLKELFQRRLTSAIFSLDPVDPDMPYHPFNQMRFAPSSLYHSQLLHTMLMTDYLLKFLTVGQEVQRCDPYELRSLDRITSGLPDHLKKVISDFHASNHKESLHRFWIESEEVELAIDDSTDGRVLFALGNIRMVVKHHKMERDEAGNLVDKEGEDEGWDCYILTLEQKQELYNGKRIIPGSALIISKDSWELIFWENQKATHRFTLEEDKWSLTRLITLQRDSQEKVKTDDSESLRQIYRIVVKAAEKTGMSNRYSPEFIFAQEFTKYYDEFAIYLPEFGRLRELSKAASLVKVMAVQRAANQEEINLIRRRLNYYYGQFCGLQSKPPRQQVEEHNYWQTTRQELKELVSKCVTKQFEEWRSKFSKEKLEERKQELLSDLRRQIGPLKFTSSSPEIRKICDECYDRIRSDYIDRHGLLSWGWYSTVECDVRREIIRPQVDGLIKKLEAQKKEACRKQLSKLFEDELSEPEASRLIDEFLEHNDKPLHEHLVSYDGKIVAKKIKKVYPEHTISTLDRALNNSSSAISVVVDCETEKAVKEHGKQLKLRLSCREKLEQSFADLGFGDDAEDSSSAEDMEGTCLWVPASFRHDVEGGHSRTVYGGVSILGMMKECARQKDKEALLRQTHETAKRLQQNRLAGNAVCDFFKKYVVEAQYSSPRFAIETNHYVSTPDGKRFLDIAVINKETGKIEKAYEIKIGKSRYLRRQRAKDEWMLKNKKLKWPVELQRFPIPPNLFYQFRMSARAEDVPESRFSNVTISRGSTKTKPSYSK